MDKLRKYNLDEKSRLLVHSVPLECKGFTIFGLNEKFANGIVGRLNWIAKDLINLVELFIHKNQYLDSLL